MKHLVSVMAMLCLFVGARAFAVTASFTLPSAATTSAGVFDSNGVLVRTLWSNAHYNAGTYTASWNGLDDAGVLRPNGSYELRVLSNNVQYTWEGVIGNTSDNFTGESLHHGFDAYFGMAVDGSAVYLTSAYNEQLPSAVRTTTTNPQQRTKKIFGKYTNLYHVVTDGTNVYWSARDPIASENAFVLVTKRSDDTEASLSGATALTMTWGGTRYTSVIDYVSGPGAMITGLAVQKTGPYLFVARRALNRLDVLDKTTGVLARTFSFTAPGALTVDADDNLWMVTNTDLVAKYEVATTNAGEPGAVEPGAVEPGAVEQGAVEPGVTLTSLGGISSGLSKPLALAVSPDGSTLAIADAGSSQQVKGYSTSSFTSQWTMGQAGGYANGPAVTNDKFFFRDSFSNVGEWAYLAYQPDGKLWVGDPGNSRTLRFDTDRSFLDRIQFVPGFYSARVDQNDSTRVFAGFAEFSVDYSKPLAANNGSWTLVRNWAWNVGSDYAGDLAGMRTVTTLATYGRTYALMRNFAAGKLEVVELPSSGNLRFTGVFTDLQEALDKDGVLRWLSLNCGGSVPNAQGSQIVWKKRDLTGLDSSNNPVWGSSTTVAASPVLSLRDLCVGVTGQPWEITDTGVLLAFEDSNRPLADWHLQGLDTTTGQWKWRAAPATSINYVGPYPADGYFDVGNNNYSSFAGGSHHASGRHIFWEYHGEGWKQGQTNKWMHLYDDGLVVGQFGVVAPDLGNFGRFLPEGAAEMAGNAFISAVVAAADGSRYIYHGDEFWHGGVHRWHVTGLDTIHEDSIPIALANAFQPGLQGTYYDDMSLSSLKAVTTRVDPAVDFNWGPGTNSFSVRWQGFVKPRYTETYTFYTSSDDGVRLWVNDVLVVDEWQDQTATQWSGTVELEADKLYQVKLEYYHHDSTASAQLSWSSASQAKEIVPSSRLLFTDVSSPAFTGLNLHDGLGYVAGVSDGLYGWHRTPAQDLTNNWLTDWWVVDTGRYAYRKDSPVDIRAAHSRTGTASLTRDLRPADASTVSAWTLSGKIAYGVNSNRFEYGIGVGQYLEVLDDAGKIIARMYPQLTPSNEVAIQANTSSSSVKLLSADEWSKTIVQTPTPFTIHAESGQVSFSFADGTYGPASLFDSTSNWRKPTTLRVFLFDSGFHYGMDVGLVEVTFTTTGDEPASASFASTSIRNHSACRKL